MTPTPAQVPTPRAPAPAASVLARVRVQAAAPPPAPPARRDRGQATVELALTLPFIAIALLLVVQVLLVAEGQLAVQHAAREAGRVAAVDPDPAAATAAARAGPLPAAGTQVTVDPPRAGHVRVVVVHRLATAVPLVGRFLPDIDLRAEATFRVEWIPP